MSSKTGKHAMAQALQGQKPEESVAEGGRSREKFVRDAFFFCVLANPPRLLAVASSYVTPVSPTAAVPETLCLRLSPI